MLLRELPYAVLLFDSTARLTFFNQKFCELWNMENYFLKKEPSYSEILDKIQEKNLLPQVKDFAQYKKIQMDNFFQLTKTVEEFLYLTDGKIIKRVVSFDTLILLFNLLFVNVLMIIVWRNRKLGFPLPSV